LIESLGAEFDPETGFLYLPSLSKANFYKLGPTATILASPYASRRDMSRRTARTALVKPPYGTLTAIDLNHEGRHDWMVPVGDSPRDP
jgi:hypothetical protein